MKRILDRFYRNYFCWIYRLRLFKLILNFSKTELTYFTEYGYVYEFLEKNPHDNAAKVMLCFCLGVWVEDTIAIVIKKTKIKRRIT